MDVCNERKQLFMNIIDKIYQLMNARDWTTYTLAEEAGVGQSTIANMFRKNQIPKVETLEKICKAFGLSLSEFFADGQSENENFELASMIGTLSPKRKELTKAIVKEFQNK